MLDTYKSYFGNSDKIEHIFSPYRIAPLGAHIDHQHGVISGFAIDKGVELLFSKSENSTVSLRSMTFRGEVAFDLKYPVENKKNDWGDYARGAV